MRALTIHKPNSVSVVEVPVPVPALKRSWSESLLVAFAAPTSTFCEASTLASIRDPRARVRR